MSLSNYLEAVELRKQVLLHMIETRDLGKTTASKQFVALCKELNCAPFLLKPIIKEEVVLHPGNEAEKEIYEKARRGSCFGTSLFLIRHFSEARSLSDQKLINFLQENRRKWVGIQIRHLVLCELGIESTRLMPKACPTEEASSALFFYSYDKEQGHCIYAQLVPPYRFVDIRLGVRSFETKEALVTALREMPGFDDAYYFKEVDNGS